jgi:hypothetical protein
MKKIAVEPQPLAYTPAQAAAALSCGEDFFREHVLPEVRCVRRGRKTFISVAELQGWLAANSEAPLSEQVGA